MLIIKIYIENWFWKKSTHLVINSGFGLIYFTFKFNSINNNEKCVRYVVFETTKFLIRCLIVKILLIFSLFF